jgi:hypothetical protein
MATYEVWAKRTLVEWVSVTIDAASDDLVQDEFGHQAATGFVYELDEGDVVACDYEFDHFELDFELESYNEA